MIDKEVLEELYLTQQLNPYQIGKLLSCNHKTVRAYLRKHSIPLRSASEYLYLACVSHVKPTSEALASARSYAAHVAYLCEGWHTDKTDYISFSNQDAQLIDLVVWLLVEVYQVKRYRLVIACSDREKCDSYFGLYPNARFQMDPSRKNPIVRVLAGGKTLARELIQNAYSLLTNLS